MSLPLDGLLIADFSRVLAGPLCTQMLGDMGARVIKVEEPTRGDETRHWGPPFAGDQSAYFLSVNRNKESLALDLSTSEGRATAALLIARADVVIDNFLPSQRAGFGMDDLLSQRPDLIHCSISGYDGDTEERDTPGYDLLAQAGAGLMSITGAADGEPAKVGVALADVLTAHHAHGAILAALHARTRTGAGARLEISLFSATLASLINVAQGTLVTGKEARRHGNAHPSIVPYQLFGAADRSIAVGAGTDRHFAALCAAVLERPDLALDPRFETNAARVHNRAELTRILDDAFVQRPASEWMERLRAARIPCSIVRGVLEALRSEPGRRMASTVGPYELMLNPVRVNGRRLPVRLQPPRLGEQTEAILQELSGRS